MNTTSDRRRQIVASLRDKEYRDLFVSEHIDTGLPFQIRAMRIDRGWSQQDLAAQMGLTQEGVSRLENPNYGKFTLKTLKRVASAFDVALVVRFAPFSEVVDWSVNLSPEALAVPNFEHDPGFALAAVRTVTTQTAGSMPPAEHSEVGAGATNARFGWKGALRGTGGQIWTSATTARNDFLPSVV